MLQQAPNQALPEIIRVKVQKGFRASIDGKLVDVWPGDVVEIPRALAFEMRAAGKAYMVNDELKRQTQYVPPYARSPQQGDLGAQLAKLTELVTLALQSSGVLPGKAGKGAAA